MHGWSWVKQCCAKFYKDFAKILRIFLFCSRAIKWELNLNIVMVAIMISKWFSHKWVENKMLTFKIIENLSRIFFSRYNILENVYKLFWKCQTRASLKLSKRKFLSRYGRNCYTLVTADLYCYIPKEEHFKNNYQYRPVVAKGHKIWL